MRTVFADTGYWIAILNSDDGLHRTAINLTTSLKSIRIVTSEMVFTEVLNSFSKQGAYLRQNAVTLIDRSVRRSNVEVIPQTSELFHQALDLYQN